MNKNLARLSIALLASLPVIVPTAFGQEQRRGDASVTVEYQLIRTGKFVAKEMDFDYNTTDSQVILISGDYALNERWTIFAALPYVRKRFNSEVSWGGDPHNPNDAYWVDFVPPDKRYIDDGSYHGDFQDFSMGMSYRVKKGPWTLGPYLSFGVPSNDYPFFAKAAIGTNLWTIPIGTSFSYVPYFSDWYFGGNIAYVISEQPLDVNVDYWLTHVAAGYWLKPNFSVNASLGLKYVRHGWGLLDTRFIDDVASNPPVYPIDWDTEEWWQHDRLIGNRNLNFGLGFDYFFDSEWKLTGSVYQSVWTEETTEVDLGITIGLTHFFRFER